MNDIYAYAYDVFLIWVDSMNTFFQGEKDKVINAVLDFLNNKSPYYDEEFKKISESQFKDLNYVKKLIMLIIASKSYMANNYDYHHDINKKLSRKMMDELETMNPETIIKNFYQRSEFAEAIIDDYFSFINSSYIYQSQCKSLIIKNNKRDIILKLNPFEILDLYDYIEDDKYTESEICIQTFLNIYEQSLLESINDEYSEEENYSCPEEFLVSCMITRIKEVFPEESQVKIFIKYLLSNVYETVVTELKGHNEDYKKYADIVYFIENTEIEKIISRFFSDYRFALHTTDAFLEGNDYLVEGDLIGKRDQFKRVGNVKLLRKLNPFYQNEEIVYKKIKETSQN